MSRALQKVYCSRPLGPIFLTFVLALRCQWINGHDGATADSATSRGLRTAVLLPCLAGSTTICDPSILCPAAPPVPASTRTKAGPLLPLAKGDEWVMVDHLLGWVQAKDTPGGDKGRSP